MAEFDLTSRVGVYLDRHLVFPLLEFSHSTQIYDQRDTLQSKLELASKTKMVDYAIDVFKTLYPDEQIPQELTEKRAVVVSELKKFESEAKPLAEIFGTPENLKQLNSFRDGRLLFEYLVKNHDLTPELLDTLYNSAKFHYDCGNYTATSEYLYLHRILIPASDKNTPSAMWGKLATEILLQNWETALDDLHRLKDYVDANNFSSALQSLQQRTWLIHWSLFVFFNHPKGRDLIIDMFLYQTHYLNAIQTMCPHILRYLTTAVITNKRRRPVLKDLVKVIQQETYTYRDPITEFLECLYVNFDFDGAQQKLTECRIVLSNDFFLIACVEDFFENARLFIFETFCRIHQCISINMLADKLDMAVEDAEHWIVNLIRNARLDAKIDSKQGHVIMGTQATSPYQQLIEKTKALSFRSQLLALNMEKRLNLKNQDSVSHWGGHDF